MITQLISFFQATGYVLELLICMLIFSWSLERRKAYFIHLTTVTVILLVLALFTRRWLDSRIEQLLLNYFWFLMIFLCSLLLYRITPKIAMFMCVGAFVGQHMAFKMGEIVRFFVTPLTSNQIGLFCYVLVEALIYVLLYCLFARRFRQPNISNARQQHLVVLYVSVALYITLLQFFFSRHREVLPSDLFMAYATLDLLCCSFSMLLQFGVIESSSLKDENRMMQHVLYMQQEKYRLSKETADLINIRCHDLKKRLSGIPTLDNEDMQKLWQAMNLYDMSVKTGNETLDILLAEKSLLCQKHDIRLECVADGAQFSFMHAADIYSLVGNALDNAIESVRQLDSHRIITLSIHRACELLIIQVENPFEGALRFREGLPVTTKEDSSFHGFGMKSIQMVVEKYGGYFSISTENQFFTLTIVFPSKPAVV